MIPKTHKIRRIRWTYRGNTFPSTRFVRPHRCRWSALLDGFASPLALGSILDNSNTSVPEIVDVEGTEHPDTIALRKTWYTVGQALHNAIGKLQRDTGVLKDAAKR